MPRTEYPPPPQGHLQGQTRDNSNTLFPTIQGFRTQILAMFCQIEILNRADFLVHKCAIYNDSSQASTTEQGIGKYPWINLKNKQVDEKSFFAFCTICIFYNF